MSTQSCSDGHCCRYTLCPFELGCFARLHRSCHHRAAARGRLGRAFLLRKGPARALAAVEAPP
eukprot:10188941-Lingulodinium_polyedra.AAC.1